MGWTDFTRRQYGRRTGRYASDLTDREWSLIAPFMPMPRRLGRPRKTELREVLNALLYIRVDWLPMADATKGFSTLFNRAGLFLRVAGDWLVAADQLSSRYGDARAGRKGSLTDGRRDRQSERQND